MSAGTGSILCFVSLLFVAGCVHAVNPFSDGFSAFDGEFGDLDLPMLVGEEELVEGQTPPHVVIERVVSYPETGNTDVVELRNIGGQTAEMKGWSMADAENSEVYKFGEGDCADYESLAPAAKITLTPYTEENPCGFRFSIGFRDSVSVFDSKGDIVARVSWDGSERGTAFKRKGDGTYAMVSESDNVLVTLEKMGQFKTFLKALDTTRLDKYLVKKRDPEYEGIDPAYFANPPPAQVDLQFPSWFGFQFNRSALPPPPPPPPPPAIPKGVPSKGPYTVLAPTDAAFKQLRAQLAGPGSEPMTEEDLLDLPELKHILLYHIIPGEWTSEYLKNNTGIYTSKGVEVVPFADGAMTEGKIMLHDSCVDKPTPDPFDCDTQVEFNKCLDPFMVSPLGAQWQGGFCQRTCQRCSCDPSLGSYCAEVQDVDVMASNGVVHSIDRVLFPPPFFTKEDIPAGTAKSLDVEKDPLSVEEDLPAPTAIRRKGPRRGSQG